MKQWVLTGILVGAVAVGAAGVQAQHKAPLPGQPNVAAPPEVPTGELMLGTVQIPRRANADGKPLAAGTYQVRLTAQSAQPEAVGITPMYSRWVEFLQGGEVRGREVVSIVPQQEIATVAQDTPPPLNGNRVQMLAGGDYLRVWMNRGGHHYLIYLVPA
jgi:hypothetical protein